MSNSHLTDPGANQQPDDAVWETIAEKVDRLVAAWNATPSGGPHPVLSDLLTNVPADARSVVLWELIKTDLEYRWQDQRAPVLLEYYIGQFPELDSADHFPADLIYEEIKIRSQAGFHVDLSGIAARFPQQSSALRVLLGTLCTPSYEVAEATDETRSSQSGRPQPKQDSVLDQFRAGDSIDDFDLLLPLGTGTFARVFLARQRSLERLVALKISKSGSSEPRTLAQLDHPNIVRVFDHRRCDDPPVRLLYMELVPGGTLLDVVHEAARRPPAERSGQLVLESIDRRLAQTGTAPPEGSLIRQTLRRSDWPRVVCQLGAWLADGLAYAHQKGVLHRDIKPANVLLTPEGAPKLADFNVSFLGGRSDENPEDAFGGSLAYMSPEQIAACHPALGGKPEQMDESSDIYSLGIVLWELASGARPFTDVAKTSGWTTMLQQMIDQRHRTEPGELSSRLPSHCPSSLRHVLCRCLSPAPTDRFRTARQLADALHLCLNPRCWHLLQPPQTRLLRLPLRFPVFTTLMLTLLPSVVAAFFNLAYNDQQIVQYLQSATAEHTFFRVMTVINAIAFPVGIAITVLTARRAAWHLRRAAGVGPADGGDAVLLLGRRMASIALTLWCISGLAYPLTLHLTMPGSITAGVYVHFLLSLALCGSLAGAYPFFFVTMLGVRWFLPEMVRRELLRGPRNEAIQRLRRLNRLFLVLTAFVPLLGILLILLYANVNEQVMLTARQLLIIASASGLVGFAAMFWLHRMIEEDLLALAGLTTVAAADAVN